MSIEIVTSPKNGVTVSLASQLRLIGHRFSITFDAIQEDSPAGEALASALQRESYRKSVSRRERRKEVSRKYPIDEVMEQLKASQEGRTTPTTFIFGGGRISAAIKKSFVKKLDGLATRLQSFVGIVNDEPKAETPNTAQ